MFRTGTKWLIGCGLQLAVIFALVGAIAIWILVPHVQRTGNPSPRIEMSNSLKQFAIGMYDYADQKGHFPPPAIYSREGLPLLSWRVTILPYIEHDELYKKFRLNEPWDSEHNLLLLPQMPSIYNSYPGGAPKIPHTTGFRVFVGPGAAFEGPKGLSPRDFSDGHANTLLIVEAAEAVPWTKPAELAFSRECALPSLGARLPDIFCAALVDGSVAQLPKTISEERLRALITRNGREPFEVHWPDR